MSDKTKKILYNWPDIGYDGQDDAVRSFYSKELGATTWKNSIFYKKKLTDIFIFAMTLGKKAGLTAVYAKKSNRAANIPSEALGNQPEYVWMMICTALEETKGDLSIFENPQKIIDVCERYANYGIKQLIEIDKKGSTDDPHFGYEMKLEDLIKEAAQ